MTRCSWLGRYREFRAAATNYYPGIAQAVEGTCGTPDWLIPSLIASNRRAA
jgi:hypothetical protein